MAARKTTIKRSHERMAWVVVVVLLLLLALWLWMAAVNKWWPFALPTTTPTIPAATTQSSGNTGTSATTGSTGSTGASGTNGTNGSNGSMVGTDIFNLYGSIISGETLAQVAAQAGSIKPDCTAVNAAQVQVCTYTQGNKVVTVTYQNGQVVAVSKSGF